MPLQNRVLPDQTIVADPARGLLTGNRGILHDDSQTLRHRWTAKAWICCALDWKATRRQPMTGRSWTELFFLDEAVALASGHRPCATCRRAAYNAFRDAWSRAALPGHQAPEIDAHLHAARLTATWHQRLHQADGASLPDGTFILHPAPSHNALPAPLLDGTIILHLAPPHPAQPAPLPDGTFDQHRAPPHLAPPVPRPDGTINLPPTPHLILGPDAWPYTPAGYLAALPRPTGPVLVMTPAPLVACLRAGYRPILHPTAG